MKLFSSFCFATLIVAATAILSAAQVSAKDKSAIEEIVRQYILENPEVITEALERLQERERLAQEKAQQHALKQSAAALYQHPMTPEHGNPKGDAVVVEFFDYQCGYCKRVLPSFMEVIESDKNLRVIWKELPILGPVSRFAARAAMASDKQGKYLEYHIALMTLRGRLTEKRVMETAKSVGLDMGRLIEDMGSPKIDRYLDETLQLAESLGINGTPAFLIGNQLVPGAISADQMRQIIAQSRETKG